MAEHDDTPTINTSQSPSLGERLQEARKQKKFTEAEVAAQLRVSKDIVTQLETQQWDKLPARTYTRGYFSNYIKLLGLPHDEMLALFNHEYTAADPELDLKQYGSRKAGRSIPWLALIVVVILALVIWYAYQEWQRAQDVVLNTESEQSEDGFDSSIVAPLEAPVEDERNAPTEPLQQEVIDEVSRAEIYQQPAASDSNMLQQSAAVEDSNPKPATTIDKLHISFTDRCWVKITDSTEQVLVSKTMSAAQSLDLDAHLPLNITLGQASAVQMRLNDKPIDLTPHIQGDIAKLTLGVES